MSCTTRSIWRISPISLKNFHWSFVFCLRQRTSSAPASCTLTPIVEDLVGVVGIDGVTREPIIRRRIRPRRDACFSSGGALGGRHANGLVLGVVHQYGAVLLQ